MKQHLLLGPFKLGYEKSVALCPCSSIYSILWITFSLTQKLPLCSELPLLERVPHQSVLTVGTAWPPFEGVEHHLHEARAAEPWKTQILQLSNPPEGMGQALLLGELQLLCSPPGWDPDWDASMGSSPLLAP